MRADFRMFKGGVMKPWEDLLQEATDFASRLGRERLINISHSDSQGRGIVVVWYWGDAVPTGAGDAGKERG